MLASSWTFPLLISTPERIVTASQAVQMMVELTCTRCFRVLSPDDVVEVVESPTLTAADPVI